MTGLPIQSKLVQEIERGEENSYYKIRIELRDVPDNAFCMVEKMIRDDISAMLKSLFKNA